MGSSRRIVLAMFAALLITPAVATGEPLCISQPDWSDYFFAYPDGCVIGDKLISEFTWAQSGTSSVGTLIRFPTPIDTGDLVGLDFTLLDTTFFGAPFFAQAGETKSLSIAYTSTVISGDQMIGGSLFSLTSVDLTGTGSVQATEMTCVGGTFTRPISGPVTCSSGLTYTVSSTSPQLSASTVFGPAASVDTILTVTIAGGASGTAKMNNLQMLVAQVPEPSSLLIFATGLSGLICVCARRRRGLDLVPRTVRLMSPSAQTK